MPNILTDELPEWVEIDGIEYPINADFRACLRVILAFEDSELTGVEKQAILLTNLYPEQPHDPGKAIELGVKFLNGGEEAESEGQSGPRVYSFAKDANYIFAAFQQTHNVDLETAEMHWWKFLALFMDLGSETTFCQLVGLRKRVKTGRASKEERRAAREMGEVFEVPELDARTPEERNQEAEFLRLVQEGQKQHAKEQSGES